MTRPQITREAALSGEQTSYLWGRERKVGPGPGRGRRLHPLLALGQKEPPLLPGAPAEAACPQHPRCSGPLCSPAATPSFTHSFIHSCTHAQVLLCLLQRGPVTAELTLLSKPGHWALNQSERSTAHKKAAGEACLEEEAAQPGTSRSGDELGSIEAASGPQRALGGWNSGIGQRRYGLCVPRPAKQRDLSCPALGLGSLEPG